MTAKKTETKVARYKVTYTNSDECIESRVLDVVEADSAAAAILKVLKKRYHDRSKEDLNLLADCMTAVIE